MKKLLMILVFLSFTFFHFESFAQNQSELWGMTQLGGNGGGVIFKTDGNGNNQQLMKSFIDYPGTHPSIGQLCQASNGNFYGMTNSGGVNSMGVLYEYNPATSIYTIKLNFDGTNNGSYPLGSLMQAANGNLYGMTQMGGANNNGVLFEYNPLTSTYTKKIDFACVANGCSPRGALVQASNGKLYGMTYNGGVNYKGALFEYDPATSTYTKKLDFDGTNNGSSPLGSLILASNGNLYGIVQQGGANNMGVIFEYNPTTSTFTKKFDFDGATSGNFPWGSLMLASNGNMYGLTSQGGVSDMGVLFEFNPITSVYTKKMDFAGAATGSAPMGSLIQATNGKLYGMTSEGGANSLGVVFEYDPATSTFNKKFDFAVATDGRNPYGSLIEASDGNLYGTTHSGGISAEGVLFEFNYTTSLYTKRFDFFEATKGQNPYGSLMLASNEKVYGMTNLGGDNNMGVLFEYSPSTSTYIKKLDFTGVPNGSNPYGSLVQTSNGKLYGMTYSGGANGMGVLFEYDTSSAVYNKMFDFAGVTNGSNPYGSLMQAANGKLYGMTMQGGANSVGIMFEYDPATSTFAKKIDFEGVSNGSIPLGSLIQASNGLMYGMTSQGGTSNYGVLFKYDPVNATYTKLLDFTGTINGKYPYGSLVQASNGKLYGITSEGGANNLGVLFEYDPITSTYIKKLDFAGTTNGSFPYCTLMQASNGKLYGMTRTGGTSGLGVVFEYDPVASNCSKKLDFNSTNGANPYYTQLIEICAPPKITATIPNVSSCEGTIINFIAKATGIGLTYQWQESCFGSSFEDIHNGGIYSGTTNDTLTITWGPGIQPGCCYRCIVTSSCPVESIISEAAWLTLRAEYNYTENYSICSGQTYVWHGQNLTAAGTFYDNRTSIHGCDSIYTLNLTVNPVFAYTENHSICQGETYTWHGVDYTTADTYTASYNSINGCDSIYTLNLTVNPAYTFTENQSICEGESYNWRGVDYTTSNTYTESYNSINGCDSIYTLNLTVNPVYAYTENHSICQGETYNWYGVDYSIADTYTASYISINGCDSIYTLNLTVNPVYDFTEIHSICDGETYTWHGQDYTMADTYTSSYNSVNGCDSIYTLNLTVNPVYAYSESQSICEGETYTWHGQDYTIADTYTASYNSINGCDSIYSLVLTVNSVDVSLTVNDPSITANATGATYQWIDCDNGNLPIPNETNPLFTALTNGNYAVIVNQGLCADTSLCEQITTVGMASLLTSEGISVYPNPVSNELVIEIIGNNGMSDFEILNSIGQIVLKGYLTEKTVIQTNSFSPGIYLLKLKSGNSLVFKKVIKE